MLTFFKAAVVTELSRQQSLLQQLKAHATHAVDSVSVGQVLGGLDDVTSLACDTSWISPDQGILYRGKPIAEFATRSPEAVWYLLLTGNLPSVAEADALSTHIAGAASREGMERLFTVFPAIRHLHPMNQLIVGLQCLDAEPASHPEYSEPGLNLIPESMRILAMLPTVLALVVGQDRSFVETITFNEEASLAAKCAYATFGPSSQAKHAELASLMLVLHADHEGCNASQFTANVVGSTLATPLQCICAGMNALAGPLHGLANQECLELVDGLLQQFGNSVPDDGQLTAFISELISSGRKVAGFGHRVYEMTDPRAAVLYDFGSRACADDLRFRMVEALQRVVPIQIQSLKKTKKCWPNVDAVSGSIMMAHGLPDPRLLTVWFGVSRTIGILAQLVHARGRKQGLIRPRSLPLADLLKIVCG